MSFGSPRSIGGLALVASLLGLAFAVTSTLDYAAHLDRGVHDLHCSLVPGVANASGSEVCRAAMYSPYSALFKNSLWGGIPISLFAIGAFSFFLGAAVHFLVAGERTSPWFRAAFGVTALTPALVSLVMLFLSITRLGGLCKTCLGIYVASALLAITAVFALRSASRDWKRAEFDTHRLALRTLGFVALLGAFSVLPSISYATTAPDHRPYLRGCKGLSTQPTEREGLVRLAGSSPTKKATLFEDPLCPTCRALHERFAVEGVFERLDAEVALMPLDSDCNWMLSEPLHPGACLVSQAILCVEDGRAAFDWAFSEQPALSEAGKIGTKALEQKIVERWGKEILSCAKSPKTRQRLNKHLHFAAENSIPISTPQIYFEKERLCDEDTDIGLSFALSELAPELSP